MKRAENLMDDDKRVAAKSIADALYMLSYIEAERILNRMKCSAMLPNIYDFVSTMYGKLKIAGQKTCIKCNKSFDSCV